MENENLKIQVVKNTSKNLGIEKNALVPPPPQTPILLSLPPSLAKLVFKTKSGMLDDKANFKNKYTNVLKCPFCMGHSEKFGNIFICPSGLWFPKVLRGFTLKSKPISVSTLKKLGKFLERYLEAVKLHM